MTSECCELCNFYDDKNTMPEYGRCRRYAPCPGNPYDICEWPLVHKSDWCGEFEPVEDEDNEGEVIVNE